MVPKQTQEKVILQALKKKKKKPGMYIMGIFEFALRKHLYFLFFSAFFFPRGDNTTTQK